MSLWGNNDNISSPGTVTLNYGNNLVVGSGTLFGQAGQAQPGDVIRFGQAVPGGPFQYFGDAVIVSIASTTELTIQDTAGLSGREISGKNYQISQSPKYLPNDAAQNEHSDAVQQSTILLQTDTANRVAAGATVITVTDSLTAANVGVGTRVKMFATPTRFQFGTVSEVIGTSTCVLVNGVPTTTMTFDAGEAVGVPTAGVSTVVVKRNTEADDPVVDIIIGDSFISGSNSGLTVAAIGPGSGGGGKSLTLSGALTQAINEGATVEITRGLAPDADITFASIEDLVPGGKESFVTGVAKTGVEVTVNSPLYKLTSAGWVGVTTYLQDDGELRVKTETFVAMSGIATGNTPWPPV